MRQRKQSRRPSQDPGAVAAQRSGRIGGGWLLALGSLMVIGLSIALYWTLSSGSNEPVPASEQSGSAPARPLEFTMPSVDALPAIPTDDDPPETHEELMEAMARMAERVVSTFPNDPTAFDLQGRVYLYLGKSDEASRAWKHCLQLDARRPDACHGLAQLAIKRGDDATAEEYLRRALVIDDALPQVADQLAEVLARTGRVEEAVTVLKQHVERVPTAAESRVQLGQMQLQLGTFDDARKNFQSAIELRPKSSEAYFGLGTALMRLGKREEAREYLEKCTQLRAQQPKRVEGMSAEIFDITMTRVNFASSSVYAARLYQHHGDLREAVRLCRVASVVDPKNLPCRLLLISLCQAMHDLPQAVKVCEDTVAADPKNPDLNWRLGVLNAHAGRYDAAESALKQVIQLAPLDARGYVGLAEVYLESGRQPEDAVRLAREAIRLEPVALHYVILGRIQMRAGEMAQALVTLNEAVKLEPGNEAYRQLRDQLQAAAR